MRFVDLGIYFEKCLVLADFHIGYEEALNKQGILMPRLQLNDFIKRLDKILSKINQPEKIIINGDLKHEFDTISEQEWRDTLKIIDYLDNKCNELILIKGNHDTILGPIAKKRNIQILDYVIIKNTLILHGHKLNKSIEKIIKINKIKTIIIAHEHPAITLNNGIRQETFKCFLKGKYKRKQLIVLPSFYFMTEGTNILESKLLSPFLTNIKNFNVYIIGDKIYDFGKIKDF